MASPFILFLVMPFVLSFATASFPAVFNFGDSNSDTGNLVAGLGIRLDLPNGQTYFKMSSERFCDGRLMVDFLCKYLSICLSVCACRLLVMFNVKNPIVG